MAQSVALLVLVAEPEFLGLLMTPSACLLSEIMQAALGWRLCRNKRKTDYEQLTRKTTL
jgi:hypothetical protein